MNAYFLFVLFVSFSVDCPFLIAPSVFSNVFLGHLHLLLNTDLRAVGAWSYGS